MKILCLHGNGTNNQIMQLQTAPLRHELEDDHEYEFVEAVVGAPMADGVEALSIPENSFYAFYNPENLAASLRQSIDHLHDYILHEGPFDAVLGFSGGAVLAAMYLSEQQRRKDRDEGEVKSPFKFAIFLSSAACKAEARILSPTVSDSSEVLIRIPTAHIWGLNDTVAPTGGEDLSLMCDPATRLTLVHNGGHELPRGDYLTKAVHTIRRTIDLAETSPSGDCRFVDRGIPS